MRGQTTALNNIVDTTPPQPNVAYVVRTAADGTPYVAASDGSRYFENSTIGQIFLKRARGRRSDMDWCARQQHPARRSDLVGADEQGDVDAKKGVKPLLGFKGFHMAKNKEKKSSASDLNVVLEQEQQQAGALVASADDHIDNELPMLDPDVVDRSRADSSWEVPMVKSNAQQEAVTQVQVQEPAHVRLLDSIGMETAHQANTGLQAGSAAGTESASSSPSASSSTNPGAATTKNSKLPRLQPKKDLPAPPISFDAYDEEDNPLCRSFQSVRDVDLIRSKSNEFEDDELAHVEEHDNAAAAGDDDFPDVESPDFAGRVRVSSGATSVADFVGGFKGQLSRRSGASGLVNRKRAVRHARLTAAEQKAAELARKIREARNRIPLEFRDEYMSLAAQNELQKKKKWRALGRHVRFNPEVQCREFEVESEEEDDGYDSPDEIVDAVQLVSKRDVVHAEDVVAGLPMEHTLEDLTSPPSMDTHGNGNGRVSDDSFTFSQPSKDSRMSFSDL
ncbi:unnamed protein product [Phytophthora fragariaefolia]|uniref:Unnamed protein product n=1 Tax=Phytophthora fragariaefolia TaxID=1490495 RepID=A0A9W7D4A3_9STRA|nr:unnamed protein product [Phytophthora fragariaefolia]